MTTTTDPLSPSADVATLRAKLDAPAERRVELGQSGANEWTVSIDGQHAGYQWLGGDGVWRTDVAEPDERPFADAATSELIELLTTYRERGMAPGLAAVDTELIRRAYR